MRMQVFMLREREVEAKIYSRKKESEAESGDEVCFFYNGYHQARRFIGVFIHLPNGHQRLQITRDREVDGWSCLVDLQKFLQAVITTTSHESKINEPSQI